MGWLCKRTLQKDGYSGILVVLENSVKLPQFRVLSAKFGLHKPMRLWVRQ